MKKLLIHQPWARNFRWASVKPYEWWQSLCLCSFLLPGVFIELQTSFSQTELCCHAGCALHTMLNTTAPAPSEYRHPSNGFPIMTTGSPEVLFLSERLCVHVCMCCASALKWLNSSLIKKSAPVNSQRVCVVPTHTLDSSQAGAHRECFSLSLSLSLTHMLCCMWKCLYVCVWVCVCHPWSALTCPLDSCRPPGQRGTTCLSRNQHTHTLKYTHLARYYHNHIYQRCVNSTVSDTHTHTHTCFLEVWKYPFIFPLLAPKYVNKCHKSPLISQKWWCSCVLAASRKRCSTEQLLRLLKQERSVGKKPISPPWQQVASRLHSLWSLITRS